MRGIDVIGMGARTPMGIGADALIEGLCAGRSTFSTCPAFVQAGVRYPVASQLPDELLTGHFFKGLLVSISCLCLLIPSNMA